MKIFSLLIPLKNNLQFSSKNKILQYASVFLVVLAVLFSQNVYSQARAYTNPGLEFGVANNVNQQADTNFGWNATFDAGAAKMSPWYTSHPTQSGGCASGGTGNCHPVEIWGTGFLGVPAAQGTNFVELNAYVSSMIYQNLYLVNGDNISYYFRHRARVSGVEQAGMVIENQNQVNIATIYATTLPSSTGAWSVNQGVYTFTGTTGLYRVGFRATNTSNPSIGNFLDDVKISMNPIIDMKFSNLTTNCEGNSHGSIFLRVNGRVNDPTTVAFELINPLNGSPFVTDADLNLTAVANSNGTPVISHTAGTNIYTVTIPIGNYDGGTTLGYSSPTNDEDGIQINVASVNDGAEGKETFKFEIKAQNTNGATNNFVSTSSPVFGDPYVGTTNDGFIEDLDSDGDGVADFCDLDDDNDGILDTVECNEPKNGSFEDPNIQGYSGPLVFGVGADGETDWVTGFNSINGWNVIGGSVDILRDFNNASDGNQSIDMYGQSHGQLQQTFNVGAAGTAYDFSIDYSSIDINVRATVSVNGAVITTLANSNPVTNNGNGVGIRVYTIGWNTFSFSGVSTGATVTVTFKSTVSGTAGTGIFLDNFKFKSCGDTDGDGIPDYLDLDSDNDGCPDAAEGGNTMIPKTSLVASVGTLQGGNGVNPATPPTSGTFNQAVLLNLGNTVGSTSTTLGVPTIAGTGQSVGSSANAAINACFCYNDPNIASAGANTNHGITLLQRAGADNGNWPMIRKSAHTALESNTKGFVITRMTTTQITAIASPQEGMMVYDTVAKCLKLYDGTAWSCFVTPTCP